jgi:RISC-loading complex subunit TARBP2
VGTGRSKKDAKHAAAKNILDKIVGNPITDESITVLDTTDHSVVMYDDKIPGNPIGTLQELCMSRRWPPPTYEMTCEEGLPHEREFTIACVVFKYREVGSGKSKKLAKRQAAHKMFEKLQSVPHEAGQMDDEVCLGLMNKIILCLCDMVSLS